MLFDSAVSVYGELGLSTPIFVKLLKVPQTLLVGCANERCSWRVAMPEPLSVPAIASLTLLTFVTVWNDYLGPLIYLRNPDLWTLQLGLQTFVSNQFAANYGLMFAGLVISVVPIAVVFLLGQKYFIEGIATSGLKG